MTCRPRRQVAPFFEAHDVFVTATAARPPARIGELLHARRRAPGGGAAALPRQPLLDYALSRMGSSKLAWTPNTQLFNQTGQPGISLPLYWNTAGLPIGVQFVGRFGDEATLLRLAAELEAARPWAHRKPDGLS